MDNGPFPNIESNYFNENNSIFSEKINSSDNQISHSSYIRNIYSINNNYLDIFPLNISSLTSSNIININSNNNNNIIEPSEKEKDIMVLIDNSNDITISNNNNYISNSNKTISKNNNYINKKRARHDRLAKDNIKRKINVYYSKFVCSLLNKIIKQLLNEKIQFYELSHSLTKNVTRTAFNSLKTKSLGDIFKGYVSPKYKKYKCWQNLNIDIYNKVTFRSKVLKKILDKPYFEFFQDFFYHNTILNLSKYGLNENILLLNNNNYFYNLKENNKTHDSTADQKYFDKLEKIIKRDFLSSPVFNITKLCE